MKNLHIRELWRPKFLCNNKQETPVNYEVHLLYIFYIGSAYLIMYFKLYYFYKCRLLLSWNIKLVGFKIRVRLTQIDIWSTVKDRYARRNYACLFRKSLNRRHLTCSKWMEIECLKLNQSICQKNEEILTSK